MIKTSSTAVGQVEAELEIFVISTRSLYEKHIYDSAPYVVLVCTFSRFIEIYMCTVISTTGYRHKFNISVNIHKWEWIAMNARFVSLSDILVGQKEQKKTFRHIRNPIMCGGYHGLFGMAVNRWMLLMPSDVQNPEMTCMEKQKFEDTRLEIEYSHIYMPMAS